MSDRNDFPVILLPQDVQILILSIRMKMETDKFSERIVHEFNRVDEESLRACMPHKGPHIKKAWIRYEWGGPVFKVTCITLYKQLVMNCSPKDGGDDGFFRLENIDDFSGLKNSEHYVSQDDPLLTDEQRKDMEDYYAPPPFVQKILEELKRK